MTAVLDNDAAAPPPPAPTQKAVLRHRRGNRWMHWINFPLITIMIWSGLRIYWAEQEFAFGILDWQLFAFFPDWFNEALGLDRKITLGPWATPMIEVLARGKRFRGTARDPFGRAEVRRVERQLPGEYLDAVNAALGSAGEDVDSAVRVAELAELVRGYEDIKLANVARFRDAVAEALS